jgi:hypothetical protein
MCVPVNSSIVRGNSGSLTRGGPPRSPSAITCRTGVPRVTDNTPISTSTSASPATNTNAMYLTIRILPRGLVRILHYLLATCSYGKAAFAPCRP